MKEEMLVIVDEEDDIISQKPRKEVEKKALLHRSADVIVMDKEGKIFVHKRTEQKFLYPGKWDIKCGGAVSAGETYKETAKRELKEELGIKNPKLKFLFYTKFRSLGHNANKKVFLCSHEGHFKLQKEEVEEGRFMTIDEINNLEKEGKLSPTAIQIFNEYLKLKNNKKSPTKVGVFFKPKKF